MNGKNDPAAGVVVAAEQGGRKLAVRVGPALAHGVTTITKADVTLGVGIGEVDDMQSVLVPFLDCTVYGSRDGGGPAWVGRLALDNVAFLLEQVAAGLVEALDPLESMAQGELRPPSARMEYAADRVASGSESLRDAAARLRAIAALRV